MPFVLEASDLTFRYGADGPDVLAHIDLGVGRGERIALCGPSGAGKTTLCRCLCGLIPHVFHGRLQGQVLVAGRPTRSTRLPLIATHVGYVFQDPDAQLFCGTVEEELAFGPENLRVEPDEIRRRSEELLERFSLGPCRTRDPLSLSGGEKQRVALAGVLAMQPAVLLLDEPTAHLDTAGREALASLLDEHVRAGRSVVAACHDPSMLPAGEWQRMVLRNGTLQSGEG